MDVKNQVRGYQTVAIGSVDQATVFAREVFRPAILDGAAAIILAHNHPSGVPDPSIQDRKLIEMLVKAGKILGVEVLDSVIVGENGHASFRELGLL